MICACRPSPTPRIATQVWEPGVPPPPASPPLRFPPLDLFPEQRIAVLSISRAGEQQQ